jgi:hypothetical protein
MHNKRFDNRESYDANPIILLSVPSLHRFSLFHEDAAARIGP